MSLPVHHLLFTGDMNKAPAAAAALPVCLFLLQ